VTGTTNQAYSHVMAIGQSPNVVSEADTNGDNANAYAYDSDDSDIVSVLTMTTNSDGTYNFTTGENQQPTSGVNSSAQTGGASYSGPDGSGAISYANGQ